MPAKSGIQEFSLKIEDLDGRDKPCHDSKR